MEDQFKQRLSGTTPEPAGIANAAPRQGAAVIPPAGALVPTAHAAAAGSFARPEADPANSVNSANSDNSGDPGDLWPEAADAKCSESAALFSGTQPAPLSVV